MNLTPFARFFLNGRVKAIARYATENEAIQRSVLKRLIDEASATEWGIRHNYPAIRQYEQFASRVGIQDYETLKGDIDRMRRGEKDVL